MGLITVNINIDSKNPYSHLFNHDLITAIVLANNKAKSNLRKSKRHVVTANKLMQ